MEDSEKILILEKRIKRIETMEKIRFVVIVLTFIGVTSFLIKKIKKVVK